MRAASPFPNCFPNPNSLLASCIFPATKDRYVFFEVGNDNSGNYELFWANSQLGSRKLMFHYSMKTVCSNQVQKTQSPTQME